MCSLEAFTSDHDHLVLYRQLKRVVFLEFRWSGYLLRASC